MSQQKKHPQPSSSDIARRETPKLGPVKRAEMMKARLVKAAAKKD